jgi:hypothetical protein
MLNIVTELNVTIAYSLNIFFILDAGVDNKIVAWGILGCIISTYAIHNLLICYNLLLIIISKLRERCTRTQEIIVISSTNTIITSTKHIMMGHKK